MRTSVRLGSNSLPDHAGVGIKLQLIAIAASGGFRFRSPSTRSLNVLTFGIPNEL